MTPPTTFESETKISAYPAAGIEDVLAWRIEVGLRAYDDMQLSLKQLTAFLDVTEQEALDMMKTRGVEYVRDEEWLQQEMRGADQMIARLKVERKAAA